MSPRIAGIPRRHATIMRALLRAQLWVRPRSQDRSQIERKVSPEPFVAGNPSDPRARPAVLAPSGLRSSRMRVGAKLVPSERVIADLIKRVGVESRWMNG